MAGVYPNVTEGNATVGNMSRRRIHARPRPDRETRRTEFVDAAITCIQRVGAGASMDQMAAEAGVTKPILYRYFGDKAALYGAIAERYVGVVGDELRRALAGENDP